MVLLTIDDARQTARSCADSGRNCAKKKGDFEVCHLNSAANYRFCEFHRKPLLINGNPAWQCSNEPNPFLIGGEMTKPSKTILDIFSCYSRSFLSIRPDAEPHKIIASFLAYTYTQTQKSGRRGAWTSVVFSQTAEEILSIPRVYSIPPCLFENPAGAAIARSINCESIMPISFNLKLGHLHAFLLIRVSGVWHLLHRHKEDEIHTSPRSEPWSLPKDEAFLTVYGLDFSDIGLRNYSDFLAMAPLSTDTPEDFKRKLDSIKEADKTRKERYSDWLSKEPLVL